MEIIYENDPLIPWINKLINITLMRNYSLNSFQWKTAPNHCFKRITVSIDGHNCNRNGWITKDCINK